MAVPGVDRRVEEDVVAEVALWPEGATVAGEGADDEPARSADAAAPEATLNSGATDAVPATLPPDVASPSRGLYGKPVPVGRAREVGGRIAGCLALVAGAQYLVWRLSTLPGAGAPAVVFWIVEAINFVALTITLLFVWRAPGRPAVAGTTGHSLDVFVTVCGEPPAMVRDTLQAALAISYPHETYVLNDGRMAGKAHWREIEDLAARLGVTCFTRVMGRPGKAGNLNHALRRTGGELIVTIDADHQAVPTLASQTLGYFSDPRLAFVTTPQQYYASTDETLHYRELFFYRVIQPAKDAANSAVSCGNGVVYRRAALDSIGGFSEWNVVEDVHTSYRLHAAGWRSAYHNHAVTTGTAPPTFAEMARQRLRWATDGVRLLLWDNPLRKRGLTWRQRAHYLHTTSAWVFAATEILFVVSPALYLLTGLSIMRTASMPLLYHSLPYYTAIAVALSVYCGPRETLRVIRQQLVLSPVYLLAVVRGLFFRPAPSSVTEKGRPASISWAVLSASLLLAVSLIALGVAAFRPAPGRAVAAGWAAWFGFALAGPTAAVGRSRRLRASLRGVVYAGVLLGLLIVELPALQGATGLASTGVTWRVREALLPPARGVYLGVFNPNVLRGQRQLEAWDRHHRTRVRIVNSYQQWLSNDRAFPVNRARMVAAAGGVLMITWEPWAKPPNSVHRAREPDVRLKLITEGRYDGYVQRWARAAAAYRGPLLIRFMQEMNGTWYPWAYGENGNTVTDYVQAWRHVHDIFTAAGATNVRWVWSINTFSGLSHPGQKVERYFPGSEYVDWVSVTGFNWASPQPRRSARAVFDRTLRALDRLRKPIMISEVGTVGQRVNPRRWIAEALVDLPRRDPRVRAIVWFDDRYDHINDFRLNGRVGMAFDAALAATPALRVVPRLMPVGR